MIKITRVKWFKKSSLRRSLSPVIKPKKLPYWDICFINSIKIRWLVPVLKTSPIKKQTIDN
ncbi:hypothetical protein OA88_10165 [Flavobacterium sp. JRM]|nr:hypothetical protein OA88_10165 [Flavobacterium sp. JRM]